jgi:hypothetical protein
VRTATPRPAARWRLLDAGYIRGQNLPEDDYVFVLGITERGLRATGAWPSDDRLLEALLASLEDIAARLDANNEPEKASRVRTAIGWLADGVKSVGVGFLDQFLANLAGLK